MIRKPQVFKGVSGSLIDRKWGFMWDDINSLGDRLRLDIATGWEEQLRWLNDRAPLYLNTLPSNLLGLMVTALKMGTAMPQIEAVLSVAELLTDDVRASIERHLGCRTFDVFSSAEGGIIAVECPETGCYHVQSELVKVEVVSSSGDPCAPGEIGEVVITPLYNFAMPLIRYRTGDIVVNGQGACACGRSLPTLDKIVGKEPHLFIFTDGTRGLPRIDRECISLALGTLRWRLVQVSTAEAELHYVPMEGMGYGIRTAAEEISRALPGFSIQPVARPDLQKTSGGKWHYIVSMGPG
jgi:phenylacetate-CoA ligase